ncbi:glycoside hydrolase family 31 protein [Jiangella rhizosphaerae]|uniref:Glycoside hydrolase family 31 n=1 Tax=Jiangella rhizosphaerae TaxID=2293569 RepID=A0A418KRL2_9ACTN|nr:TIM-barrel domain-containing protein [Jiangella rhizosphaerae]RIQ24357.1 glycoside hydrolase family 31 [Jiangella rhizosphaerae]
MIRHRPFGSEHPYAVTGDQRVPALPVAGESCELRVRASDAVVAVVCEWAGGDGPTETWPLLAPSSADSAGASADGGHLAAAQARSLADRSYWSVRTPPLAAGTTYRYRFVATTASGATRRTRWFSVAAGSWSSSGGRLDVAGDRLVPGSVEWLTGPEGPRRVRFALRLASDEHVVGFGERYDAVDQRGRTLDAVVFEQYKAQGAHGRTYLPMPFALVVGPSSSWGFHVRTARRTWYDVGATTPDRLVVEADLDGDDALSVGLYAGSPAEVVRQFVDEAGRPEVLPDWVFRLWASGNEWNTQARVMAEMDAHREHDIPVGALVIEAWSDESTFTAFRDAVYDVNEDGGPHRLSDFTFPADGAWPDPKGMVDELHARDVRVLLWQIPLLKMRPHPRGQLAADARAAVAGGFVVTEADGRPYRNRGWWFPLALMPDLASEKARTWWTSKRRYLVEEVGIDGFKTDGGEHAWGHDLVHGAGSVRGLAGNNRFPVEYARAYGDLLRSAGRAPVTFSRAGFTGSQAHGAFWAGDEDSTWDGFRSAVVAGVTAGACGIVYWGWDLAGFSGDVPDAELYLRAAAASAFMPIMQYHSEFNHHRLPLRDRTPWNVAERTGDPRVLPVFRRFAHLRERLVAYLSSSAASAVAGGAPLMRGLFFDHPGDESAWSVADRQFLLGDSLLVAPVLSPDASAWDVYLPSGSWVDVWTGEPVPGGQVVTRPVPIDEIPVYCRSSAWPSLRAAFTDLP